MIGALNTNLTLITTSYWNTLSIASYIYDIHQSYRSTQHFNIVIRNNELKRPEKVTQTSLHDQVRPIWLSKVIVKPSTNSFLETER